MNLVRHGGGCVRESATAVDERSWTEERGRYCGSSGRLERESSGGGGREEASGGQSGWFKTMGRLRRRLAPNEGHKSNL